MDIISRKDALAQGLKHYFTGKPCKRGHVTLRYVSGPCLGCVSPKSPDGWAARNPEKRKAAADRYNKSDTRRAMEARKRARNHDRLREYHARWRAGNSDYQETRRAYNRKFQREKRATDMQFAMVKRLRDRLACVLRTKDARAYKAGSVLSLMGCSKAQLVAHIESQFLPGMSWENRSEWHIDHIIPCSHFDMADPEQQRIAFHYTNLRPLWATANISKGDRFEPTQACLPLAV